MDPDFKKFLDMLNRVRNDRDNLPGQYYVKITSCKTADELIKLEDEISAFHLYIYRNPVPSSDISKDVDIAMRQLKEVKVYICNKYSELARSLQKEQKETELTNTENNPISNAKETKQ